MRNVIVLSGPMTGREDFNRDEFTKEATRLRGLGYEVVNPGEMNLGKEARWGLCIGKCLEAMRNLTEDRNIGLVSKLILARLPGWECSAGSRIENFVAVDWGLSVQDAKDIIRPA